MFFIIIIVVRSVSVTHNFNIDKRSPFRTIIYTLWFAKRRFLSPQPGTGRSCQGLGHGASVSHGVPVYSPAYADTKLYCLVTKAVWVWTICPMVALDSAWAWIEAAISSRNSNATEKSRQKIQNSQHIYSTHTKKNIKTKQHTAWLE